MKRLVIKPFISKFIPCRWQKEEYYLRLKVRIIHHVSPSCLLKQFITARKRSLGQGHIFTSVCHSVHRGGDPSRGVCIQWGWADPPSWDTMDMVCIHPGVVHIQREGLPPGGLHPVGYASTGSASGGFCFGGGLGRPPPHIILWHTVNKRAVRMLLECNLVTKFVNIWH